MAMRLKVLSNEMLDTLTEEAEVEGQRQAAAGVLSLLQGQEKDVLGRCVYVGRLGWRDMQ